MSKTALTTVPLQWGPGFHFCSVFPSFDDLFMFHLKRADVEQQMSWFAYISQRDFKDKSMAQYYAPNREKIMQFHTSVSAKKLVRGWEGADRTEFRTKVMGAIKLDRNDGIYRGAHFQDEVICELPQEFADIV
jgi:hypothetical protein